MKKTERKKQKSAIPTLIVMLLFLFVLIAIFIWDIRGRIKHGWSNNDTITWVFFVIVAIAGSIVIKMLSDYLVNQNKEIKILNNKIYRLFVEMEQNGLIHNYENFLLNKEKSRVVDRIESIIKKKDKNAKVNSNNLGEYFNEPYGFYKGNVSFFKTLKLESLYRKTKEVTSSNYEKLYRSVHNGDLIRNIRFPLFESITPLLFSFIGIFVTIYQTLSIDGSIQESLIGYLKLFGSFIMFASIYTLYAYNSLKEDKIRYKTNILKDLESCNFK